jgi:NAD(P)-dependent dehydrogenase (short-subunit alcohol dehydrogenase family)
MRGLANRTAIVTGGAASIGAAIVEAFAQAGSRVAIFDVKAEDGERLAARLGDRVLFKRVDITDDTALGAGLNDALARFGRIDFIVNNACTYLDNGRDSERDQWLAALNVNLVSGAMLVRMAREHLARNNGAVVNLGSISAKAAQTGRWLYPVSKAGILHLTRLQAMDYAQDGIRVNSVSPGWTWSEPIKALSGGDQPRADRVAASYHLLRRLGRASEVAAAVLFLCSDEASFITGADLAVDGGYSAMGPEQAEAAIARLTEDGQAVVDKPK